MSAYKQKFIVVMESGKIVKWTGKAINGWAGRALAIAFAEAKTGEKIWDICNRPAH